MIVLRELTPAGTRSESLSLPLEAAEMTQNLAYLVSSVNQAQYRLRDMTPRTAEWRVAQRAAVQARVEYWDAMCLDWDLRHRKTTLMTKTPEQSVVLR